MPQAMSDLTGLSPYNAEEHHLLVVGSARSRRASPGPQKCVTSTGTLKAAKAGTKRPMQGASKPKTGPQKCVTSTGTHRDAQGRQGMDLTAKA